MIEPTPSFIIRKETSLTYSILYVETTNKKIYSSSTMNSNEEIETYSYVDFIHNDKSKELIACDVGKKNVKCKYKIYKM